MGLDKKVLIAAAGLAASAPQSANAQEILYQFTPGESLVNDGDFDPAVLYAWNDAGHLGLNTDVGGNRYLRSIVDGQAVSFSSNDSEFPFFSATLKGIDANGNIIFRGDAGLPGDNIEGVLSANRDGNFTQLYSVPGNNLVNHEVHGNGPAIVYGHTVENNVQAYDNGSFSDVNIPITQGLIVGGIFDARDANNSTFWIEDNGVRLGVYSDGSLSTYDFPGNLNGAPDRLDINNTGNAVFFDRDRAWLANTSSLGELTSVDTIVNSTGLDIATINDVQVNDNNLFLYHLEGGSDRGLYLGDSAGNIDANPLLYRNMDLFGGRLLTWSLAEDALNNNNDLAFSYRVLTDTGIEQGIGVFNNVPTPGTAALFAAGGLAALRRRRQ